MKRLAYNILYSTGLLNIYQKLRGRQSGTISYHNILPDNGFSLSGRYYTDISLTLMECQLQFLQKNYNISGTNTKGFLLSFDDGMLNNYEIVLPLLRKYNIKAMFAICPFMIEGTLPHIWRDHIYLLLRKKIGKHIKMPMNEYQEGIKVDVNDFSDIENSFKTWIYQNRIANIYDIIKEICFQNNLAYTLEDYDPLRFQFMNWSQIRQIHSEGHLIASHTCSHRIMRFLSSSEKRQELLESRQILEEKVQAPIQTIVYPYGSDNEIDDETVLIAESCGYIKGYLNINNSILQEGQLTIPRFSLPCTKDKALLLAITSGLHDNLKKIVQIKN